MQILTAYRENERESGGERNVNTFKLSCYIYIFFLTRYNSGAKQFKEVLSKSFSLSVDALTIKNEFWHSRKSRPPF